MKALGRILLFLLWLVGAGTGAWGLMRYENTPSSCGKTPAAWPANSRIDWQAGRCSLIVFLHPHFPCSRASIADLNRLLGHCQYAVNTHVLFIRPAGVKDEWMETS